MLFWVQGLNKKGKTFYKAMEAQGYERLLTRLDQQEIIPLNISEVPPYLAPLIPQGGKKVSQDEVIELIENLQLVIRSGLPLYQGIVDLTADSDNEKFKNMLLDIADDVNSGRSFSVAFEKYKKVIGNMMLNLIKIGEETGELESTLARGVSFLKKTTALKKKAKSALIYPMFSFIAVFGAMLVWMIFVLPQMTSLFDEMDVELPTLTIVMISLSSFLANYIGYMIGGLVILVIAFKFSHTTWQEVRLYTDKFLLKIPIIKDIISSFNIAFIAEYMRLALISGVPITSALKTLQENTENELYKGALKTVLQDVEKGNQLSKAFAQTGLFTAFMIRMMSVGESAGTLDSQLETISNYYYDKVDYFADNIGKFIEPVILIVVGGFMALVMVGLMGPMYDLIGKAG